MCLTDTHETTILPGLAPRIGDRRDAEDRLCLGARTQQVAHFVTGLPYQSVNVILYFLCRSFEALGVRAQRKDITQIFDRLDTEEIGLISHDALITRLFPGAAVRRRSGADSADLRADSDVRVALRKRPDLLEEVVNQLKTIESRTE